MFSGDRDTISRHNVNLRANASYLVKENKKAFRKTKAKPNGI